MKIYKITLYDPKTHSTSILAEMPERRKFISKEFRRPSVIRRIKDVFGSEWYSKNKFLIGIFEQDVPN